MSAPKYKPVLLGWRIHLPSSYPYILPTARKLSSNIIITTTTTTTSKTHRHHHLPLTSPQQRRLNSTSSWPPVPSSYEGYAKLKSDPLRILFCGSDEFSTASLRALLALQDADPSLVESIDVLVRPGKPIGRGRKTIHVSPLQKLARELNLPLHMRDTFTGWDLPLCGHVCHPRTEEKTCFPHPTKHGLPCRPPQRFNLIIAVSFGLFVPPRIINSVKYGGLNLHPSLLPDLRGPAPLHWTILARRPVTGVTLQTLHPAEYDRGVILAQTPAPGLPVPEDATSGSLLATLAREGANLLVEGLKQEVHVPPYEKRGGWWPPPHVAPDIQLRDAPKMTRQDVHIDWRRRTWAADKSLYPTGRLAADDIVRRARAMTMTMSSSSDNSSGDNGGSTDPTSLDLSPSSSPPKKPGGVWSHALLSRSHAASAVAAGFGRHAPQDKRVILTATQAVPCPPELRDMVKVIVQIRRAVLLLSARTREEEDGDEEDYDDDEDDHVGDWAGIDKSSSSSSNSSSSSSSSGELSAEDSLDAATTLWAHWDDVGRDMSNIGSIAWSMPEDPRSNTTHEAIRLPVMVDEKEGTVTIPIGVPYRMVNGDIVTTGMDESALDALQIKYAKVAGSDEKPAATALRQFLEMPLTAYEVQRNEYAVDVMAHRLD